MTRKIVGFTLIGALVGVLIYPGIPVNKKVFSRTSPSGGYTKIDCYRLFITGVRHKHIEIQHEPGASISLSGDVCSLPG